MKNFTTILKAMFAVFFILQIIFYTQLYAGNNNNIPSFRIEKISDHDTDLNPTLGPESNQKFRIGGISKLFTSAIVLQMVDEKRIQLGTPLTRFFPEIPNAHHISIEDLMSGKIQITHYLQGGKYYQPILSKYVFDELAAAEPKPNSQADGFNDANYLVLGMIIEKVSGQSYADELNNRIIKKISLMNTFDGSMEAFDQPGESQSEILNKWDLQSLKGAGSVVSTLSDIYQFVHALFSYQIISEKSLNNMVRIISESGSGILKVVNEKS